MTKYKTFRGGAKFSIQERFPFAVCVKKGRVFQVKLHGEQGEVYVERGNANDAWAEAYQRLKVEGRLG